MANKHLTEDEIRYTVDVKTADAQKAIYTLEQQSKKLRSENKARLNQMISLEAANKKETDAYKNLKKQYTETSKEIRTLTDRIGEQTSKIDILDMSMVQLKKQHRCPGVSCGLVRHAYRQRLQTLLQSRQPQHRQHGVPRPRAPLLRPNREDRRRRRQGGVCGQRCARGKAQDRRHVQGRLQVRRHGAGRQEGRPRRGAPPAHGGLRGMGAGPASPSLAEAGAAPCAAVRCGVLALRHERARRRGTWSSRTTSPSRPSESSS